MPKAPALLSQHSWAGRLSATLVFVVFSLVTYAFVLHPWLMNWGASPEEQAMALPGDPEQSNRDTRFTRGITIRAPGGEIWPWIIQIGQDRAGFYSYSWLENLTGADIHNANQIHSEWQHRMLGERVPLARHDILGGALGDATTVVIRAVEPGTLVADLPGQFVLIPIDDSTTRVLLREPIAVTKGDRLHAIGAALTWVLWDPAHFVMEQRMLRGIQERAEALPLYPPFVVWLARLGWIIGLGALLAAYLSRGRWRPWLILPIVAALPAILSAGDLDAATAGSLAVAIPIMGALRFGKRWWPPFLVLVGAVLLVLLLAPDAYVVFGLALGTIPILATVIYATLRLAEGDVLATEQSSPEERTNAA